MLQVSPVKDNSVKIFRELFTQYYAELDCEENCGHLLDEYVMPDLLAGLIKADVIAEDGQTVGFVIYQTDDINNDWNFKEGWGNIREIYISPSSRGKGLGKFLLYTAEFKLKESGTDKCYCLPTENALPFFLSCGYAETEEYNEELECAVWTKTDLNNGCRRNNP